MWLLGFFFWLHLFKVGNMFMINWLVGCRQWRFKLVGTSSLNIMMVDDLSLFTKSKSRIEPCADFFPCGCKSDGQQQMEYPKRIDGFLQAEQLCMVETWNVNQ